MNLDDFKPYNLSSGLPTMTVAKSGISFSQTAVIRLGKPEYVELLVNTADKVIAIRVVDEDDPNATPFYKPSRKVVSAKWNYQDFNHMLEKLMGWDTKVHTYRINGTYSLEDRLLVFDLKNPRIVK